MGKLSKKNFFFENKNFQFLKFLSGSKFRNLGLARDCGATMHTKLLNHHEGGQKQGRNISEFSRIEWGKSTSFYNI